MSAKVCTPNNCRGPLNECLRRDPRLTEAQWHRGQMRGYAGYWRRRFELAALLGIAVEQFMGTDLALAKIYRDSALKLEGGAR